MVSKDADEIIRLRDSGKSWGYISRVMGYKKLTCQEHYRKRTNGIIYNDEWIALLDNVETEKHTYQELHEYVMFYGYPRKLPAFRTLCHKYKILTRHSNPVSKLNVLFEEMYDSGVSFDTSFFTVYSSHYKDRNSLMYKYKQLKAIYVRRSKSSPTL